MWLSYYSNNNGGNFRKVGFNNKVNGILNNRIMSANIVLIIYWWKNEVKSIKNTYQSVTLIYQGQGPSLVEKTIIYPLQWYHNIGTEDATFTASSHSIPTGYSAGVTYWSWN